jgi:hypothetical protein
MCSGVDLTWQKDFLKHLCHPLPEHVNADKAMVIKHPHLPRSIFRYRTPGRREFENVRNGTVWLTAPKEYNDPYDSAVTIIVASLQNAVVRHHLDDILGLLQPPVRLSQEQLERIGRSADPLREVTYALLEVDPNVEPSRRDQIWEVLKSAQDQMAEDAIAKFNALAQDDMRVCSFSATGTSIIMWSHYADSHRGFCVEYDLTRLDPNDVRLRLLCPVIYSEKIFDATPYFVDTIGIDSFNSLLAVIATLHKSHEWAYEEEWRLLSLPGLPPPSHVCPMPCLKAVYLGARMKQGDKTTIGRIATRMGATVFQMRLSRAEFRMETHNVTSDYA